MKLSYADIEHHAEVALNGFMGALTNHQKWIKPIPIEYFTTRFLGLRLEYIRLSDDGNTLGMTTYSDTRIKLRRYLRSEIINVPKNTVLIDERLMEPQQLFEPDKEIGHRRFTIAHECAHQMLYRMESKNRRGEMDCRYSTRTYSLRELKSLDDWCEWQANVLAAALIIPKKYVDLLLGNRRLTLYGKRLNRPDRLLLCNICNKLKVSHTAMSLRLQQLGYMSILPLDAFYDPTDVECDNDYFCISTPKIGGGGYA